MNLSFVAPPSGVLPPTIFGAITNIRLDPVTLTFMVYDPDDQTNNYWPNDLFEDGVTFSAGATYATTISDRPTTVILTGTYSTQAGPDLNDILLPPDIEGGTQQGSDAVAFQFSHLLQQLPDNPPEVDSGVSDCRHGWQRAIRSQTPRSLWAGCFLLEFQR